MNLYDAFVIVLEATVEMDDDRQIRNARKRIAKKVESMRQKRLRAQETEEDMPKYYPCWIEPTNKN